MVYACCAHTKVTKEHSYRCSVQDARCNLDCIFFIQQPLFGNTDTHSPGMCVYFILLGCGLHWNTLFSMCVCVFTVPANMWEHFVLPVYLVIKQCNKQCTEYGMRSPHSYSFNGRKMHQKLFRSPSLLSMIMCRFTKACKKKSFFIQSSMNQYIFTYMTALRFTYSRFQFDIQSDSK